VENRHYIRPFPSSYSFGQGIKRVAANAGKFRDNAVCWCGIVISKGNDFQFRKFAIDESMQGMGVGGRLLNYITDFSIKTVANACGAMHGYPQSAFT